jgi:hypothetical protein
MADSKDPKAGVNSTDDAPVNPQPTQPDEPDQPAE